MNKRQLAEFFQKQLIKSKKLKEMFEMNFQQAFKKATDKQVLQLQKLIEEEIECRNKQKKKN